METPFAAVGLRIKALRGDLSQREFASRLGVDNKSVSGWESGKRLPDGSSLLALMNHFAADVNYILTGQRAGGVKPAPTLTPEEETMLSYFRDASKEVRRAALGALLGAAAGPAAHHGGTHSQHAYGDGSIQVGHMGRVKVKK